MARGKIARVPRCCRESRQPQQQTTSRTNRTSNRVYRNQVRLNTTNSVGIACLPSSSVSFVQSSRHMMSLAQEPRYTTTPSISQWGDIWSRGPSEDTPEYRRISNIALHTHLLAERSIPRECRSLWIIAERCSIVQGTAGKHEKATASER